jgi:hypothetical protein
MDFVFDGFDLFFLFFFFWARHSFCWLPDRAETQNRVGDSSKARRYSLSPLSFCTRSSSSIFELLLLRDLLLLHFGKRFCHWVSAGIPILALCIFLLSVAFSAGKLLLGL